MRILTLTAAAAALAGASLGASSEARAQAASTQADAAVSEVEAQAIHERVLTLDTHIDIGRGYATSFLDPGQLSRAQVDLPKMRMGGLDAGFFIVYIPQGPTDEAGMAEARQVAEDKYQAIMRMIRGYPDQIALATDAGEVEAVSDSGRLVALIGMENAYPLGNSVEDVPMWAERGVRYVGLTHFGNNQFGGSSNPRADLGDPEEDPGLTDLGRELVAALNDHGIMVDVSHVGKRTMMEATELSRAPVIASHSGAKAVYDNARNLDDEQLRAIADRGGVAQMVAFRAYLTEIDPETQAARDELRARLGLDSSEGRASATAATLNEYALELARVYQENPDVTLDRFLDHIDHAVEVVGVEHVGIVSDFDGGGGVQDWNDASETFNVTKGLLDRGYTEEEVAAIWGGNVLRVLGEVRAAASQ